MNTQVIKSANPLAWIASIAVILFSTAGIAAIMGWMPTSLGHSAESPALEKVVANTKPAAPKSHAAAANGASNVPAIEKCAECGVIESTREVTQKGEGSGIGAVGGAVVGGLLGNQVGSGRGNTAATAIGAVGGVIAGNEIEKRVRSTKGYETTIRFDDGSSRVISEGNAPTWRTGDHVKVVAGVIQANP